jgi:hypothetical protein
MMCPLDSIAGSPSKAVAESMSRHLLQLIATKAMLNPHPSRGVLELITLLFPASGAAFNQSLAALLSPLGQATDGGLELARADPDLRPRLCLDFCAERATVAAEFAPSGGRRLEVALENVTGESKRSPHAYAPVKIETVSARLAAAAIKLIGFDHAGINLPWFGPGLHPRLLRLRADLAAQCLYHRFPTGEPWDFILPGDLDEIAQAKEVDYTRVRKPKFELVSFEKSSTPLVQFDVAVNVPYEHFRPLFPEALDDPGFRNIWVYLETPYSVDICLVLNEAAGRDWSDFFLGSRLT